MFGREAITSYTADFFFIPTAAANYNTITPKRRIRNKKLFGFGVPGSRFFFPLFGGSRKSEESHFGVLAKMKRAAANYNTYYTQKANNK